jgi:hypothetical protein
VTLDINVKFNSKPTFINIVYAYSQPFWSNFDFLSKIFFFYQMIVLFEFLFENHITSQINKKIFSMISFTLKIFLLICLFFIVLLLSNIYCNAIFE